MCCDSSEKRNVDVKPYNSVTHGVYFSVLLDDPFINSLSLILCIQSKSPCEYAIRYHNTANINQDSIKLRANTKMVQRHLISTSVVKISYKMTKKHLKYRIHQQLLWTFLTCKYLLRLLATFPWTTLQSPDLKMTRFLTRLDEKRVCLYLKVERNELSH